MNGKQYLNVSYLVSRARDDIQLHGMGRGWRIYFCP